VLDPASGYHLERNGTNGFTCYVQRTDYTREDFNDGYIVPECQGPEGGKAIVPVEFDIEQLRASGAMSPHELKLEIERRFKTGIYHAPSRPGIAYMLSPVLGLYAGRAKTTTVMNMPHFMFYAPNLTKEEFGTGPIMGSYPYLINSGPMGYIILHAGAAEKAAINEAEADLLTAVCKYRASLCITGVTPEWIHISSSYPSRSQVPISQLPRERVSNARHVSLRVGDGDARTDALHATNDDAFPGVQARLRRIGEYVFDPWNSVGRLRFRLPAPGTGHDHHRCCN
jgi:hypothetical protein